MASYLPSITDYIPQIQEFRPDYNFYGNILQSKQGQFDANHKQLSGVYSTLLNSPMTHDSNIQARDAFFKAIDQDIKKVSGMDLSLSENAASANKIFSNFYNDKYMVNDMVKTKNWISEQQRGENFRNCIGDECDGQYWETGMQALEYKRNDFRKASREQTLGMDMGRFVANQNFTDKAFKAAKEAGFNIKVDSVNGGYIVTTKNGQQLTPQLHDYFMAKFGDDPKMMDVFKTQAYVQRKNYIAQAASITGDEAGAENEYISSIMNAVPQQQKAAQKKANEDNDSVANRMKVIENHAKENGYTPGDEIDKSFQDLKEQLGITSANKAVQDKAVNTIETAQNIKDPLLYKERIDDIVAYAMLQQNAITTAQTYAMKDVEVDIKADPYRLADYTSNLSLRNMMAGKEADFNYMLKKEEFKMAQEDKKKAAEQEKLNRILGLDEKPIYDPSVKDAASGQLQTSEKVNIDERNRLYGERTIDQRAFVRPLVGSMKEAYDAAGQSDVKGGSEQQKLIIDTAKKVFEGTGIDATKFFNDKTYAQEAAKLDRLSIATTKIAYEKALTNVNPNAKGMGSENAFWSKSFWDDHAQTTEEIKVQEKLITSFDNLYKKNALDVKADLIGKYTTEGSKEKILMANNLTDSSGRKLTKEQFAKDYASKNQGSYQQEGTTSQANSMSAASTYSGAQAKSNVVSPYQKAYEAALNNYDKISEDYSNVYQVKGKVPESLAMLQGKGGAKATGAYWYKFDPLSLENTGTLTGYSIFKNYDQLKGSGKVDVKFGGTETLTSTDQSEDTKAKVLLDLLQQDSRRTYKETDDKRPAMRFRAQNIAAGDPNMTAVHFEINPKWASQYTKKGGPLEGISEENFKDGVTLFIPKEKATNAYYMSNQRTNTDRLLELEGKLDINLYPDAGKLVVKKVGNKYIVSGNLNDKSDKNETLINPFHEEIPEEFGLKADMIIDRYTQILKNNSIEITNFSKAYNIKNGIKNIQ